MAGDGYAGKILEIDLTNQKAAWNPLPDGYRRQNVSGKALAVQLLRDHTTGAEKAFSEGNPLILATALLTGTGAPGSNRFDLAALSPKDDLPAFSNCGGNLGRLLKKAGCDALLIKGKAPYPQWIEITDRKVEFRDARFLWGLGTGQCREQLSRNRDAASLCIGPAGENLVKSAALLADGHSTGRAGLGAVLGWKNLKAITVSGSEEISFRDPEKLAENNDLWHAKLQERNQKPFSEGRCPECPLHCSKHHRQENPLLEDLGLDAVAAEAAYIWAAEQGLVTENLYEQLALGTDLGRQLVEVPHRTKSKAGKRRDASRGQIASAFSLPPEAEETAVFCANFAEAVSVCGQCLFTVKALEPGNAEMFLVRALECVTGQSWNLERLISLGACSRNLEKQLKKRFQK